MGGRADIRVADPPPTPGPRLRTPTRPPRSHGVVGHCLHHDPPPHPGTLRRPTSTTLGPASTSQPNHGVIIYQQALRDLVARSACSFVMRTGCWWSYCQDLWIKIVKRLMTGTDPRG